MFFSEYLFGFKGCFTCPESGCILNSVVCDFFDNCYEGEDEVESICRHSEFISKILIYILCSSMILCIKGSTVYLCLVAAPYKWTYMIITKIVVVIIVHINIVVLCFLLLLLFSYNVDFFIFC